MRHLFASVLASTVLLGAGIYHGLATDRWAEPKADERAGNMFASVSNEIGDWVGERLPHQEDEDSKTSVINMHFTNRITGKWIITSITSGRAGRVSVHNPEHCYLGNGYKLADTIHNETLTEPNGEAAQLWTGHFQKKKGAGVESIRIWWAWTADGRWQAPTYPRLYFAAKPRLHKLYVICPAPADDATDDSASYKEFIAQYTSELSHHVRP